MATDRRAYQKEYYQTNKDRIKKRRVQHVMANGPCLFDDVIDSGYQISNQENKTIENKESNVESISQHQRYQQAEQKANNQDEEGDSTTEPHRSLLKSMVILFLIANTIFLIHEQALFFLLKKYSLGQSVYFAILMESALLLLSYIASSISHKLLKTIYYILLAASIFVSTMIVCSSVEKRDLVEVRSSEKIQNLNKQIQILEKREELQIANIEALDPVKFPTKRSQLSKILSEGIGSKLEQKRKEMAAIENVGIVEGETEVMKWMRLLAIAWNVLLIHSLSIIKNDLYF